MLRGNRQECLTNLGAWGLGEKSGGREKGVEKGSREENMRKWDSQDGERTEMRARKEIF